MKHKFEVTGPQDKPIVVEAAYFEIVGRALVFRSAEGRAVRAFAKDNWDEVTDLGQVKGEA